MIETELSVSQAVVTDSETPPIYEVSTLCRTKRSKPGPHINGPADAHRLMRPLLRDADREHFFTILLSTKNHVLAVELVSVGSLSASIVHPREVFKRAIVRSAAAMLLVHNHPSNDVTTSAEDIELTRRLMRAGELLGIRVLDHLIVGADAYVSLREDGHLC